MCISAVYAKRSMPAAADIIRTVRLDTRWMARLEKRFRQVNKFGRAAYIVAPSESRLSEHDNIEDAQRSSPLA